MGARAGKPPRNLQTEEDPKPRRARAVIVAWKHFIWAAAFIGLSFVYLTQVAPGAVPLPEDVKVPFPAATKVLEGVCAWCGENATTVAILGLVLLVPGLFPRFTASKERYYTRLAILVALALGFTYISISAPIDRLIHAVEKSLPSDQRFPK